MLGWLFGKEPSPTEIAISGDGSFDFEIVGESFYQKELEKIAGKKTTDGKEHFCTARLICENDNPHDSNAVAVRILGSKVGHLSRHDAKEFRRLLMKNHPQMPTVNVDAVIVGGWKNEHSEGHYGVKLDF